MRPANEEDCEKNPYLNDRDRPIYAVFRLVQQLPSDITNAGPLTHDQSQMAAAVAFYAEAAYKIIFDGLAEIGKLISDVTTDYADRVPHLGGLIRHLSIEAQFMQETAADYRDAAMQPCRKKD